MGLLTIIRKARLKERQVRVLMLCVPNLWPAQERDNAERHMLRPLRGLDNAGKTTICKAILGEDVDEVSPTLGFNIRTILHRGFNLNVCASTIYALMSKVWRPRRPTRDARLTLGFLLSPPPADRGHRRADFAPSVLAQLL